MSRALRVMKHVALGAAVSVAWVAGDAFAPRGFAPRVFAQAAPPRPSAAATVPTTMPPAASINAPSDYIYAWTASADTTQSDFLAVIDARAGSRGYGRLITTVPVPGRVNVPHHTEHALADDRRLFANGFGSGRTFVFDLSIPQAPRIVAQFGEVNGMMHPHSYLRLPNGNVLATFQMQHVGGRTVPGGLAELTTQGRVVRSVSANVAGVDTRVRPYSAAILPAIDRVFTTTTDMSGSAEINTVQLWRLRDLKLLSTFDLPNGPRGNEGALTAEPRVLPDGKSLLVSTFNCALFHVSQLESAKPVVQLVSSFPQKKGEYCAIPVIAGQYYLVTVPAWNAVVSLDISDPLKPREVSRVTLGKTDVPHWISLEPNGQRVVLTGYAGMENTLHVLTLDARTGRLALDMRFREPGARAPGFRFAGKMWPHGGRALGAPHGAVFSR